MVTCQESWDAIYHMVEHNKGIWRKAEETMEVRLRGELPSRFSLPEKNDRHKNRLTNRDSSHFSKVLFPPNVNRPSPVILFG